MISADLNRDGKPDLIALGEQMTDLVWYENPGLAAACDRQRSSPYDQLRHIRS